MPKQNKPVKPVVRGWVEVLYRRHPLARLSSAKQLDLEDYDMVGSKIPISEFGRPFEVYDMLSRGQGDEACGTCFAPRAIRQYDIINLVRTYPKPIATVTLLVIDPDTHDHLRYDGPSCVVDSSPDTHPLGLLQLEHALPSVLLPKDI